MILHLREENRSFTMNIGGERYTVTHTPAEFPDDVGKQIYNLFEAYLIMEPSPILVQESQPETETVMVAKEIKAKRKHK